jgi:hypothetical protein
MLMETSAFFSNKTYEKGKRFIDWYLVKCGVVFPNYFKGKSD